MSQAAKSAPAGPDQPAMRPRRTRLLLVPLGVVLVVLAIPGGAYGFARNQLSQARASETNSAYGQALNQYATVQTVAGNPVSRVLMGAVAAQASAGTAETHFLWGVQLNQQGREVEGEIQL